MKCKCLLIKEILLRVHLKNNPYSPEIFAYVKEQTKVRTGSICIKVYTFENNHSTNFSSFFLLFGDLVKILVSKYNTANT